MLPSSLLLLLPLVASPAIASSSSSHAAATSSKATSASSHASSALARTDEASEALVTSYTQECTPYNYAPVASLAASYPAIWERANLSKADSTATSLYSSIESKIPNVAPRAITAAGDTSAAQASYSSDDPDCWWTYSTCNTPKLKSLADDVYFCPEPNTWGLTLDDGPNCSHNIYFDYLMENDYKATLFYIGSNVLDWPLEAQRGLADGHEICAHTWSHPYMTSLTNEEVFAELYYSKKAIHDVLGITVRCWRAPYGDVDDRVRFIAASLDMVTILWNHDTNDWLIAEVGTAEATELYDEIIGNASLGAYNTQGIVVLTHEIDGFTMNMSQAMLPKISKAFQYVTPVGVCNNNTHPYIEQEFQYPTFDNWVKGTHNYSTNPAPAVNSGDLTIPSSNLQGMAGTVWGGDSDNGVASSSASASAASASAASASAAAAAASDKSGSASSIPIAGLSILAVVFPAIMLVI